MTNDILKITNEFGLWIVACGFVAVVVVQVILYSKLSFKASKDTNLSKKDCWKAMRTGMISSIGPNMGVFVVMIGLISVIGGPLSWARLAVIGGPATELYAASMGAQAYGVELGGTGYDLTALATTWWAMAINGIGWITFVALFAPKMESIREKIGGGDERWLGIFGIAATLGLGSYIIVPKALEGGGNFAAIVGSGIVMFVILKLSERITLLKEYALGIAMVCGLIATILV